MLTMRVGTRRRLALLLRALGGTVVIGAVVGGANGVGFREAPLLGTMLGALGGATNGVILVGAIYGTEIFLPPTRLGHALERPRGGDARLRGRGHADCSTLCGHAIVASQCLLCYAGGSPLPGSPLPRSFCSFPCRSPRSPPSPGRRCPGSVI